MPIYTKTGDKGETGLFGGRRVKKHDPQIEASAAVDEVTSFVGLVITQIGNKEDKALLTNVQRDLYVIMSVLCGGNGDLTVAGSRILQFENYIDITDKKLPRLVRFVLPGGTAPAGWFHLLRTAARRAERVTVKFFDNDKKALERKKKVVILQYLNRLSDLFFIMARKYAKGKETVT